MIGITVTAEAYVAIKATLPADTQTWPTSPAHQGDVVICLDQAMVDRLGAMRGPGESYSDVILRLGTSASGATIDRFPGHTARP
jgi:hypothetical protein